MNRNLYVCDPGYIDVPGNIRKDLKVGETVNT